jgi:hypothetical protein
MISLLLLAVPYLPVTPNSVAVSPVASVCVPSAIPILDGRSGQGIPDSVEPLPAEILQVARGKLGNAVVAQRGSKPQVKDAPARNACLTGFYPHSFHDLTALHNVNDAPTRIGAEPADHTDRICSIQWCPTDSRAPQKAVQLHQDLLAQTEAIPVAAFTEKRPGSLMIP